MDETKKPKWKKIRTKPIWAYIKILNEVVNPVWLDDEIQAMTDFRPQDVVLSIDHPDFQASHKVVEELVTHEVAHIAHPSKIEFDETNEDLRAAYEDEIERVEKLLWESLSWRVSVSQWLVREYHTMVQFARSKGVSFS